MTNPYPSTLYIKWIENTNNPEDDFLLASEHPSEGATEYHIHLSPKGINIMNGTCKNCGADRGLHHYQTMQCPVGGYEAPIGRKQEWMSTTFEDNENDDLRARVIELENKVARLIEALPSAGIKS